MAEALGIAGSIIAIIQLSGVVAGYVISLRGGTETKKRLRNELLIVSDTLSRINDLIDTTKGEAWATAAVSLISPDGLLKQFERTLQDLEKKIRPPQNRVEKIVQPLRWPFDEKDVAQLLSVLERYRASFHTMLGHDGISLSLEIRTQVSAVDSKLVELQKTQDMQSESIRSRESREVLAWLSPLDFSATYERLISARQPGTGRWLLDDDARFTDWKKGEFGTLFCEGMPGAGKTMLSTIIIEHLRQSHPKALIGYAYYNYKANAEQTPAHMLGGIFRELVRYETILPSTLLDLYRKRKTGPSEEDLVSLLSTHLDRAFPPKCFIIIDALDEASSDERSPLLGQLFALQSATGFSFLATSRSIPNISSLFEFDGVTNLGIRASKDDLTLFVKGQIPMLSRCVTKSQDLQNMVVEVVSGAVDGMFLLASLHMVSLKDKLTPRSVKAALHALPRGLDSLSKTYDGTMDRINAQTGDVKKIALDALMWITFSKRTLSVEELRHAIAIESDDESSVEEDNLAYVEDILSACAGLITLEDIKGVCFVRFIHHTAQEYFTAEEKSLSPNAGLTILRKCLDVLGFESERTATLEMLKGCQFDPFTYKLPAFNPSFFLYATVFWIAHARETPEDLALSWTVEYLSQPAESLLETVYLCLRWQPRFTDSTSLASSIPNGPHGYTGLHLAAAFGHISAIRGLLALGADINAKSEVGLTPLDLAVAFDEPASVQTLLGEGLVVDESHKLFLRIEDGARIMMGSILDGRQKRRQRDSTPLGWACGFGSLRAVKVLVGSGANVELSDRLGATPLSRAIRNRSLEIVKLLLEAGASIDTTRSDGQTLLHIAGSFGAQEISLLLLAKGLDVHAKSRNGSTALHTATTSWTGDCVKVLLDAGAEVDARDNAGRTPLHVAAASFVSDGVKLLLDAGAEIDARDNAGQTPLHAAAASLVSDGVKALLDAGAEIDARDNTGQTPLHLATIAPDPSGNGMKVLLDAGAEVDARDNTEQTPLHIMATFADIDPNFTSGSDGLEILLDAGAEIDARDDTGRTPLHLAAFSLAYTTIKILLSRGARADALTHHGSTAKQLLETDMIVLERERHHRRALKDYARTIRIIKLLSRWQEGETANAGLSSEESSSEVWSSGDWSSEELSSEELSSEELSSEELSSDELSSEELSSDELSSEELSSEESSLEEQT